MTRKYLTTMLITSITIGGLCSPMMANAHCIEDSQGRTHCDNGQHNGWQQPGTPNSLLDWKTRKILKGGLVGAGVGAGAGLLLDKPVGKTAVVGAGIGAGSQAVRYSETLNRHPIVKTAAYGALTGAGVSQVQREGSLSKGLLWGGAIGAGVGALKHAD